MESELQNKDGGSSLCIRDWGMVIGAVHKMIGIIDTNHSQDLIEYTRVISHYASYRVVCNQL